MNKTAAWGMIGLLLGGCGGASSEPATPPTATAEMTEVASTAPTTAAASSGPTTATPTADGKLEMGKAVFANNCVTCHAEGGKGNVGPNLTDAKFIHGSEPKDVLAVVRDGHPQKQMPAWGKLLNDAQLDAVVAYVVSLSKKP